MFQVVWLQTALNELAQVWVDSDSALRHAISEATQAIDRDLQNDPLRHGESRPHNQRIMFHAPLGVTIEVRAHPTNACFVW
jgi:hypothetical protein